MCQYVPKYLGNKVLKRILFIKMFLNYIEDRNSILFVIDEMGIGTSHLRNYGYSIVGTPAVLNRNQLIR